MLGFETNPQVGRIGIPARTGKSAALEIGSEDLNRGLGGGNLHGTAGRRVFEPGAKHEVTWRFMIHHQAMIVAAAELLFLNLGHPLSHAMWGAKIHGRSVHGYDFAGRYERIVSQQVFVCIHGQNFVQRGAGLCPTQVPVPSDC